MALVFRNIKIKNSKKDLARLENDLGIPIELISVNKANLIEDINYMGTILAKKSITLSPSIGGQITDLYVEEGDIVQSGDILAKINDSQLRASYTSVEKKLEILNINKIFIKSELENFYSENPLVKKQDSLKSNYEYIKKEAEKLDLLHKEGAIPKTEYEKIKQEENSLYLQLKELEATSDDAYNKLKHEKNMVESQINEVNSSLKEIEVKIDETLIKSPGKGLIKKLYYEKGELVAMGKPFVEIDDNDDLIVSVDITESDLQKINIDSKAILKIDGLNDEVITKVSKVRQDINPNTRIGTIEIGPIKFEENIKFFSGNSINVRIIINEVENNFVIPKSTIKKLNDKNIVYIYKDGVVEERVITTGLTVGENTEVIKGLEEGDKIASKNLSKLYEAAKVYVFKGAEK